MIPDYGIMHRRRLIFLQPGERLYLESDNEGIVTCVENRRLIDKALTQYFEHSKPTRELGHIADEPIAWLDSLSVRMLIETEPRDAPRRLCKRLVSLG